MKFIKRFIGQTLWDISEYTGVSLGRFAPHIFGWMIGRKGVRK
jgi:hypothetical protein